MALSAYKSSNKLGCKDDCPKSPSKACKSSCQALYKVDTYAETKLKCREDTKSDAGLNVKGRIILSDRCEIKGGCVTQDECDPCVTHFDLDIVFPIRCEIDNVCRSKVGTTYIRVDADNNLYNKVKLISVSKHEDKDKHGGHKNDKKSHQDKKYALAASKNKSPLRLQDSKKSRDTARV